MKKILKKQKLILTIILFTISSLFLFISIYKNAPVAYGQSLMVGKIIYHEGYFLADNSVFGGPECGICLEYRIETYSCGEKTCTRKICIRRRTGMNGTFTEDSACKAAYGPSAWAGSSQYNNEQIDICTIITTETSSVNCYITIPTPTPPSPPSPPCSQWENGACLRVATSLQQGTNNKSSGDISTNPAQFIVKISAIILSFGGGIALLIIILAGYKILTSRGKPDNIQQGKDQLIAAILGLIFIIFSFIIFQLIFSDILKIPGITP